MILHIVVLSMIVTTYGAAVDSVSLQTALARAQHYMREVSRILVQVRANDTPRDCSDLKMAGQKTSGVYTIFVNGGTTGSLVYCDMDTEGGGWTVIQKRGQFGNNVFYFYRNWTEYAQGFGEPNKEYWIGNDALHALTSDGRNQTLRIEVKNRTGEVFAAQYNTFRVDSESNFHRLTVSGYSGPAGSDSFSEADEANFSTFDREHNAYGHDCAKECRGGWWYTTCHLSNLNGLNLNGRTASYADGIVWSQLTRTRKCR